MKNRIAEIFNGQFVAENQSIIKSCDINRTAHVKGIFNILCSYEPQYTITTEIKPILSMLLDYFSGNPESKLNLSKGIFIVGGVGVGKSLIFKALKAYTRDILGKNSFICHTAKEIVDNVNINGINHLQQINNVNGKYTTIYIDDIASGNELVLNYGTKINSIEKLISSRYDIYTTQKRLTHLTSNKYPVELKEIYGERITDRLREMCNVIELGGKSFRQ